MAATTVEAYLKALPEDRRAALEAVRKVILRNLDKDYQECMQYGMIGYSVPHRVFPAGYHCDPKQPLPFAGLASQKSHMSLYMMGLYMDPELTKWFASAWAGSGKKKLDMGKACVRFKRIEDVPLDVIGEAVRRMPAKEYIALYQSRLAPGGAKKKAGTKTAKKAAKKVAKKPAGKKAARRAGAKR